MSVTASPGADRRALHMTSTAQVSSDKQRLRIAATSIATVVGSTGPAHADNLAGGIAEVMACFLTQYVVRDVTVYTMLCCMHALLRCKPLLVKKKRETIISYQAMLPLLSLICQTRDFYNASAISHSQLRRCVTLSRTI